LQVLLTALGHTVEVLRLAFGAVDHSRSAPDQQVLDPVVVQHPHDPQDVESGIV
jgi:hypothetical protein